MLVNPLKCSIGTRMCATALSHTLGHAGRGTNYKLESPTQRGLFWPLNDCSRWSPVAIKRPFFTAKNAFGGLLPTTIRHKESHIVPYTADEYFNVVMDVNHYADFLPWCKASVVDPASYSRTSFDADLIVGFAWFSDTYKSRIETRGRRIEVKAIQSGVFENLTNRWHFTPLSDGQSCQVDFELDFKFASIIHHQASFLFVSEVAKIMTKSFDERVKFLRDSRAGCSHAQLIDESKATAPSVDRSREDRTSL